MVTFAPAGFAGMIEAHGPIAHAGRLGRLVVPYLRMSIPMLAVLLGFVAMVELTSFRTIGEAQGKHLVLFGRAIDVHSLMPWLVAVALLVGGGFWLRFELRAFARVWDNITADLKQRSL
jgi:branched-chain amino acid transport system permease protein